MTRRESRKENPQKLTQLSSRSHPRHLVGKRTAQKDTIIDITSDSQANSNFPYRWSPASLTFNNYFYLFLYLYITRITINNNAPRLKSPKSEAHCYTNRHAKITLYIQCVNNRYNSEDSDQPARPLIKVTSFFPILCTGRM